MTSIDDIPRIAGTAADIGDSNDRPIISGRLIRIARPRSETFAPLDHPELFLDRLREGRERADLFSFTQRFSEPEPRYNHHYELESVAILEIESYEKWWKETVNDKTRNMVRKAGKKGVLIEGTDYTDDFVHEIKQIYDECPVRQGKKSRHYGKSFDVIKHEHATFLDRSEFITARFQNRLIGFAKVVFQRDFASIMNLIALLSERDKSPTNALLAKVIERCAARNIGLLHYGVWSRRGFGDFKIHHGFQSRQIPRYYVPLTGRGGMSLKLGLHRPLAARIPEKYLDWLATMRTRWYGLRHPMK
jgi:hypothetical protein